MKTKQSSADLVRDMLNGSVRATARLITLVEANDSSVPEIMKQVYPHSGKAYVIGFTGAPGAGKSTVVGKLARLLDQSGKKVAIIAIDPSSPFTGGALLGDRIRMMEDLGTKQNVFIRSLGSRGEMGGLSEATYRVANVLDAFGKDYIFVETVGAGQAEIEVTKLADSVVVVLSPGMGDEIQAMKAGTMEIGDIVVLNKADQAGADMLASSLKTALHWATKNGEREPVLVKTIAVQQKGIEELWKELELYRDYSIENGQLKQRREKRIRIEICKIMEDKIMRHLDKFTSDSKEFEQGIKEVSIDNKNPSQQAEVLLETFLSYLKQGESSE
ncbi:MAG: methylmalonyl Co-A mutase-associated GTPase MeaB [Pseudomonadota bacterium]